MKLIKSTASLIKIFKTLGTIIIIVSGMIFLLITAFSEKLPTGGNEIKADEIADKMLKAINDSSWQKTGAVSWEYRKHKFVWDKLRHFTQVKFDRNEVLIDINARIGFIVKGNEDLSKSEEIELCEKAWKLWVNDSFWLNPISKCKDPGTTRLLVKLKDGRDGLMVSYSSGGDTPGDSYVWILDDNYRPTSWKLWVSLIPIKGLELTWEGWQQLSTGTWISTKHKGIRTLPLSDPIGYPTLDEMTGGIDIFEPLLKADIYF